ncbi:MAG TPA: hypothetical protein VE978_22945 [Chitinophagales bacterium]|nr:hypothetical protein [Chitinophagales bacterium]
MFNELSILPTGNNQVDANERMIFFSETMKKALQNGFTKIRSDKYSHQIELATGYSLNDWLLNKDIPQRYKTALFGVFIHPFLNLENEIAFEKYDQAKYYFEDAASNIARTECLGLAAAHIYESMTISIAGAAVWLKNKLPLIIVAENKESIVEVLNVAKPQMFDYAGASDFVDNLGELELVVSPLKHDEKKVHLSEHHGKAELKELCDQLKYSPYVIEIKSTEWGGKSFVRKVLKDGTLELVLNKTDKKYALWVKTTGRNFRETKAISEILENRYS